MVAPTAAKVAPTLGGFGAPPATTTAPTLGFGTAVASSTAPTLSFNLGGASGAPAPATTGGFSLSTTTAAAQPVAPASTAAGGGFGGLGAATTSAPSLGFNLGGTTTSSTGLSLGGISSATSTPASSAAAATGLGFGSAAATTTAAAGGFALPAATSASLTSATSTVASGAPAPAAATMTFRQLEENINKWSLELEDMEKQFLNQATMVNGWDQMLIKNGGKIVALNESVAAVRADQQRLDHELDFVASQQAELEEALAPLEAALSASGQVGPMSCHHLTLASCLQTVDSERERTYALAESLDGQLARMSEDLKVKSPCMT
jgi:nuclear pore complex protein Nup62